MNFKEFLSEATSGAAKWEKYFSNVEHITKIKKDTQVYTTDGVKIPNSIIKKGEVITVPVEDAYNPKALVIHNNKQFRVSFNDIDKPIAVADKLQLKPDFFEITGEFKSTTYKNQIIKLIQNNKELDSALNAYLVELIKHATGEKNSKKLKEAFEKISTNQKTINSINKDFLEIIGPIKAMEQLDFPKTAKFFFPTNGSEPLYDFKILVDGEEHLFSSKTGARANSNTLKPAEVYAAVSKIAKFKKRKHELKILELIANSSVKGAPAALAEYIKKEFGTTFKVPKENDLAALSAVERKIVEFINSKFSFIDMLNAALPDLWVIKISINKMGEIDTVDLSHTAKITKAKLRSKNSPGHYVDRIGFQM